MAPGRSANCPKFWLPLGTRAARPAIKPDSAVALPAGCELLALSETWDSVFSQPYFFPALSSSHLRTSFIIMVHADADADRHYNNTN